MFMEFASGYYCRSYWVQSDTRAKINQREYEQIREGVYSDDETPVVMKLGNMHFKVVGEEDVPGQTLCAPREAVENAGITREPDRAPVLLAKEAHAEKVLQFEQGSPDYDISAL